MTPDERKEAERNANTYHATCAVREAVERGAAAEVANILGVKAAKQILRCRLTRLEFMIYLITS